MQAFFGYLTGVILVVGFIPYLIDILDHKTKPERASWLIWSVLGAVAFTSQTASGANWSLILPGIDTLIVLGIFLLSVRYGTGGLSQRDIIALTLASIGLAIWYFTKQPFLALLVTIGIDAAGAYLTVIKTYAEPETETLFAWIMAVLAGLTGALAVGAWNPSLLIYPLYIMVGNGAVAAAILLGSKKHPKSRTIS
jgi:hypothetical protein